MALYGDLLQDARTASIMEKLTPVSAEHLAALEKQFEGIPADYVVFLQDLGAGAVGDDHYMLYGGLLTPGEIFDDTPPEFSDLLLFGDDFQGWSQAFDPASWSVVEIDSTDMSVRTIAPSFEAFIRGKVRELLQ
ncbi:hypothetical protein SAMN03159496_01294 [Rhizobium sp. NFR07]|uniref:SMI1/KNR4 family protein n=1 Tax=Rhizobium sp. NFR07 TaxID=1566262 RepID=UPI0008F3A630|nr:hypothetical protein SAMN03159496_01294 [Rhizobium sp. NFR07]